MNVLKNYSDVISEIKTIHFRATRRKIQQTGEEIKDSRVGHDKIILKQQTHSSYWKSNLVHLRDARTRMPKFLSWLCILLYMQLWIFTEQASIFSPAK